jgi:hypothetical protein
MEPEELRRARPALEEAAELTDRIAQLATMEVTVDYMVVAVAEVVG